jgi:hypothetical protein
MIRLLPSTDTQTISFIPREYVLASDLSVVIKEDGTRKVESIYDLTSTRNGNFLEVECPFSILSADISYSLEIKQNDTLLYRDKIYCTAQVDRTISHTLNANLYNSYAQPFSVDSILISTDSTLLRADLMTSDGEQQYLII